MPPNKLVDHTLRIAIDSAGTHFGSYKLDEITAPPIRDSWNQHVQGEGRTTKTGQNDFDAISGVLGTATDLGLIEESPTGAFRAMLRRKLRTQRGRSEAEPGKHITPIEDPAEIERLVTAARVESSEAYLLVLLLLDAGLRLGKGLPTRSVPPFGA